MVIKAKELADKHSWYWPNQFDNEANAYVHEKTTGPEILEAMGSDKLDNLFVAYGTGGTLNGVSKVLKDRSPSTKIHVVEPDNGKKYFALQSNDCESVVLTSFLGTFTAPMLFSEIKTEYPSGKDELPTFQEPHPGK